MSTLDTITVPAEPLFTTQAWRDAVAAVHGVCTCAGVCGAKHAKTHGRCEYSLAGGYRLFLTDTGHLLCARCFDGHTTTQRKAARAAADAVPEPESLLDLLATTEGTLT